MTRRARAVIEPRNVWTFPESLHVGIMDRAMRHYGKAGEVAVRARSISDIDLRFVW